MPLYSYHCDCGYKCDEIKLVAQCEDPIPCRECGGMMGRIISLGQKRTPNFHKPIEMMSLAVDSREEAQAMQERNPNIRVPMSGPNKWMPIAKNRAEKLRILRTEGFTERN